MTHWFSYRNWAPSGGAETWTLTSGRWQRGFFHFIFSVGGWLQSVYCTVKYPFEDVVSGRSHDSHVTGLFSPVSLLVYCYLLELLTRLVVCFHCWTDLITASFLDLDTEASLDLHLPPVFIHLQTALTHRAAERGDSLDPRRKTETFKEFKTSQPSAQEQGWCMAGLAESLCTVLGGWKHSNFPFIFIFLLPASGY